MYFDIAFPEMVFCAGCFCVMWSDVIVCFGGFMYNVMWFDVVWSCCGVIRCFWCDLVSGGVVW